MRPIKFRAWNKESYYMYDPDDNNMEMFMYLDGVIYYDGQDTDDYILMQYTGLKDKNGKEIYEGDILNIPSTGYDVKEYNHRVIWNEDTLTYEGITKSGRVYELWYDEELEIIGNIHENPELLEK